MGQSDEGRSASHGKVAGRVVSLFSVDPLVPARPAMLSLLASPPPPPHTHTTTTTTDYSLVRNTIQGSEYGVTGICSSVKIYNNSHDHNKMGFCCAVAYLARVEQVVCVHTPHGEREIDTKNAS